MERTTMLRDTTTMLREALRTTLLREALDAAVRDRDSWRETAADQAALHDRDMTRLEAEVERLQAKLQRMP
jgi:hypothetical protein